MTDDYEKFLSRVQTDKDGNRFNPITLIGVDSSDKKTIGKHLQEIAKSATTGGEYLHIGELYGFPILVKSEAVIKEGIESRQNRFFIEETFKYTVTIRCNTSF